jgi:hypothetical protein
MIGVTTNVVTSVEVTPDHASDYVQLLRLLLASTAKRFNVEQVSADKAYSRKSNLEAVALPAHAVHPVHESARSLWLQQRQAVF